MTKRWRINDARLIVAKALSYLFGGHGARRSWLLATALVAMTVIVYCPVRHAGFIWDDDGHVTKNTTLRTFDGLKRIWCEMGATQQYYPMVYTTFWVEYHLWRANPFGYHVVNVLLHSFNAILVWLLLRRLGANGAWLAAAIFALHPVHVESVAWVAERKNLLSGFFYLSSLLMFLRFRTVGSVPSELSTQPSTAGRDPRRWRFYGLALVLYLFALLSKSVACSLPVAILLIMLWKHERLGWKDALALLPFVGFGLAMGLTTIWAEEHLIGAAGNEYALSLLQRCLLAGRALWFYAGKLIQPQMLIFVYPRWQIDTGVWWQYLFALGVLAVITMLYGLRRQCGRGPLVAVLFFALTLVPALGFFNVYSFRYTFVADHFQYLASVGLIALAVAGVTAVLRNRIVQVAVAVPVVAALGALSWHHCEAFRDNETLFRDTIAKNPGCWLAYNNLGMILRHKGDVAEAIRLFAQAAQLRPDFPEPQANWAEALLHLGQVDEAITHYEAAIRLAPDPVQARKRLSVDLLQRLGASALHVGKVPEAVVSYEQALQIQPQSAAVHFQLARALIQAGNPQQAISHLQEVIRLAPDSHAAHNNLAWLLATYEGSTADQHRQAIQLAKQACGLWGGPRPDYLDTLAAAYAADNRFPEAIDNAQRAAALARAAGETRRASQIEMRLEMYRAGRAYREPVGAITPTGQ